MIPKYMQMAAAAKYYQAAENDNSALASFNLGYMHEFGRGVARDFPLAKELYDRAVASNPEAYLPVWLSLLRLRFTWFFHDLISSIAGPTTLSNAENEKNDSAQSSGNRKFLSSVWFSPTLFYSTVSRMQFIKTPFIIRRLAHIDGPAINFPILPSSFWRSNVRGWKLFRLGNRWDWIYFHSCNFGGCVDLASKSTECSSTPRLVHLIIISIMKAFHLLLVFF